MKSSIAAEAAGDWPPGSLSRLVERYCAEVVLRPASRENYRTAVRVFERDTGLSDPRRIVRNEILVWRDAVLERGSAHTWNSYRRDLKSLLNFAVRRGWITANPFLDVGPVDGGRKKKTVTKPLLVEALALLRSDQAPVYPGWFWATALKVLLFTGMRRRQLAALRWRDLDFQRETILLVTEGSKTRREWEIPMPPQCVEDLRTLHVRTLEKCRRLDDRQVFWVQIFNPSYQGEGLTVEQVTRTFYRLSQRLDRKVTAHRLRHTMATELAQGENPDLKSLQYLLGHTNLATTMQYVHPEMSQLRRQMAKLTLDEQLPSSKL